MKVSLILVLLILSDSTSLAMGALYKEKVDSKIHIRDSQAPPVQAPLVQAPPAQAPQLQTLIPVIPWELKLTGGLLAAGLLAWGLVSSARQPEEKKEIHADAELDELDSSGESSSDESIDEEVSLDEQDHSDEADEATKFRIDEREAQRALDQYSLGMMCYEKNDYEAAQEHFLKALPLLDKTRRDEVLQLLSGPAMKGFTSD